MGEPESKIQLDYAPPVHVLRRRWVRVGLTLLVIASLLGGAWWKYRRRIPAVLYAYKEWRCMRFSAAKDLAAYEEDEPRVAALALRKDYLVIPQVAPPSTKPVLTVAG